MKIIWLLVTAVFLTACDSTEIKREIGYKGKARINPWLAAERFAGSFGNEVRSLASWKAPDVDDAVWFVPAPVLSNQSFTRRMKEWVEEGGHLVLLVEHSDSETSDWSRGSGEPRLEPALLKMLERVGIRLQEGEANQTPVTSSQIEFSGRSFAVDAKSTTSVSVYGGKPGVFASVKVRGGRMTVITDARLFRNRWIGEEEHAALLEALITSNEYEGAVGFLRGAGLSLWGLLGKHLWPVLLGLAVLALFWLWKSLTRFGPVESADGVAALRGYAHHLEALGDFQWRLDQAAGLLGPLRAQIVDHGERIHARSGRRDEDFFQFLADRAELPRERVSHALAASAPSDSATLTRTAADLQKLLQVLH